MPLVLRPPGEATPLTDRLAALGRSRRFARAAAGLFMLFAATGAGVLLTATVDWLAPLPAFVRAALLAGGLAAVGVAYLRTVRGPARESVHPLSVALLLEEKYPRLNDSLASAVEFLAADDAHAKRLGSPRFRRVAVVRAQNLAERFDIDSIVPSGRAWRAFWLAALVAVVAVPFAAADRTRAGIAAARLLDPYGGHRWPAATTVTVGFPARFPARHAKGDPFELRFTVAGVLPPAAVVHVRLAGGATTDEPVPVFAGTEGEPPPPEKAVDLRFDPGRVPTDFEVRVTANDADTGWLAVSVAPPPALVPLDGRPSPQVRLDFPAYTDLPGVELPDGTGVVEAVAGTRVGLRAAADRRIAAAVLRPQFDVTTARAAAAAALAVGDNAVSPVAAALLVAEASADVPVRVSGADGTRLEADFTPRLPGLYALRFTDETGLTGSRLIDVRAFPDPAPAVALARPDPARDPLTLLPTAAVPLLARAEDRTFAVRSAALEYRVNDGPFRTRRLVDLGAAVRAAPAVVGSFPGPLHAKPTGLDAARTLPLASLTKPDGTPPADGDTVTVRVAAFDWDDVNWSKDPGRSREVEIRVLGKSSLDTLFQKELAGLRPDLLRLREEQRAAREAVAEAAKLAAENAATPADRAKLERTEKVQRTIAGKLSDPDAGPRAKADKLRQTLRANDLPRSPTADRVEAVAADLARLADEALDAAGPAVAAAKDAPDAKTLAEAAAAQQAAEAGFDQVLERLEQWAGAGEVRGQARGLQSQLNKAADDAARTAEKVPTGTAPDKLAAADRAALEKPAGKLDQLAKQADDLVGKAARLADDKARLAAALAATAAEKQAAAEAAAGTPAAAELKAEADALRKAADKARAEADALAKAAAESGGLALPEDLRGAADALRKNQPGRADARTRAAAERLDKLAESLTETPTETADELRKKRDAAATDVDRLAAEQDELRKKAKAAAANPDPAEREAELKKLAPQQEQLRRRADQLAERLTREGEPKPAEALRRAAEQMDAARDALERGRPPEAKQEESLDKLDEALDRLDAEGKKDQERLSREKREELADRLRAFRDRQKAAADEADRLHATVAKAKAWSRAQLRSYADLDPAERALADEVRAIADKELADLPVFARMAAQAAAAMDRAAAAAAERVQDTDLDSPFEPDVETLADERVRRHLRTALRRLDQILAAVSEEPKPKDAPTAAADPEQPPGGEAPEKPPEPDGAGQPGGVPPLAQLKALRALQAEINERTAGFAKANPDRDALTDDTRDELKELEDAQREIAELFDQLAPGLLPMAGM